MKNKRDETIARLAEIVNSVFAPTCIEDALAECWDESARESAARIAELEAQRDEFKEAAYRLENTIRLLRTDSGKIDGSADRRERPATEALAHSVFLTTLNAGGIHVSSVCESGQDLRTATESGENGVDHSADRPNTRCECHELPKPDTESVYSINSTKQ